MSPRLIAALREVVDALAAELAEGPPVPAVPASAQRIDLRTAAAEVGESVRALRRAIRDGRLPAERAGRSYVVMRTGLECYASARRVSPRQPVERVAAPAGDVRSTIDRLLSEGRLRPIAGGRRS